VTARSKICKGVAVGSCRINRLVFANDLVLLTSAEPSLQHALNRFCMQPSLNENQHSNERITMFFPKSKSVHAACKR